jgi:hypothetical protein
MSNKKDYAECKKLGNSPSSAGWKCPCCNPYGKQPRKMKKEAHRLLRRVVKQKDDKNNKENL